MSKLTCQFCGGGNSNARCTNCGTVLHRSHCNRSFSPFKAALSTGVIICLLLIDGPALVFAVGIGVSFILGLSAGVVPVLDWFSTANRCIKCGKKAILSI